MIFIFKGFQMVVMYKPNIDHGENSIESMKLNYKSRIKKDISSGEVYNSLTYTEIKYYFLYVHKFKDEFPMDLKTFISSLDNEYLSCLQHPEIVRKLLIFHTSTILA